MRREIKFRIFVIISIIVFCIASTIREFQNDTFYIIKLGDYIVNNGMDKLEHFSFIGNLFYTYPHWLYDVIIYLIYNYFGYMGIYISNIILFIILIFSVYYINLKIIKNDFISGISSILSIFLLYGFVSARSQLVSMILFIWQIYFILRLIDTGKWKYSFGLVIICLILANVHATIWPMYFILFFPFLFEEFVYFIRNKIKGKKIRGIKLGVDGVVDKISIIHINNFKLLFFTFLISLFMGLFTPSRICYSYVFRIMMGNSQGYISEHLPLYVVSSPFFLVMLLLLFVILIFTRVKIKLSDLCMIFGLSFMAVCSNRHLLFFFLISTLFIFKLCGEFLDISKDRTLDMIVSIICNRYVYMILIILVIFCGYFKFIENRENKFVSKYKYPIDCVKYIKDNLDYRNIRIFNDYNFGSYLLFNDIDVFIDSRSDLYMDEFNNLEYDIFDDFINIKYNYEEKFDYYDIDYVLEYVSNDLSLILYKDANYKVIYEDEYFVLFERLS